MIESLGSSGLLVTGITLVLFFLLLSGRVSFDALGIGLLVLLVGVGLLDMHSAMEGFSNHAVLTIAALYVVGAGLTRTGAVRFLARAVLAFGKGQEFRLVLAICTVSAGLSAFLNNTAVVVVFIPILIGISRETGIPASRLLIPMSYASLLGGMCTLVGTSTNLLVDGVGLQNDMEPMGMFEMTPVGLPIAILGILFMATFGRRLLPNRVSLTTTLSSANTREYVTEFVIGSKSELRGVRYDEAFKEGGPRLLFLVRGEQVLTPPSANSMILEEGDVLALRGDVTKLTNFQGKLDLHLVGDIKFDPRTMTMFELAVSPHAGVLGRRIKDLHLWRDYNAAVIAVLRHGQHIRERVADLKLQPGDLLLVCGDDSSLAKLQASSDFYLLTGAEELVVLRGHARKALFIAAAVVVLFTLGSVLRLAWLPLPVVAMAGAMAMVVSGCLTARRAYRSIDWPILIFVVGTLALGEAMGVTGVAQVYADSFVGLLDQYGSTVILGGFILLAIVFNAVVAHSAVAVLLTPIAIQVAAHLPGTPSRAFLLAVAFGGSIAFVTPQGHQVNLMVYGPGGYKYTDFLRLGIPVSLIAWVVATIGLALENGWW